MAEKMVDRIINSVAIRVKLMCARCAQRLEYISRLLFFKNVIVHLGMPIFHRGVLYGNIGDAYLYLKMEKMFSRISKQHICWIHRCVDQPLHKWEIYLYNLRARLVLIGGHGLIMHNNCGTNNSGWMFNTKIEYLKLLRIPICFMGLGFNHFRGQEPFDDRFVKHINFCVANSIFFGLRNEGSIRCLQKYLYSENREKLSLFPCPTTMARCYDESIALCPKNQIAICLAFDRFKNRFGDDFAGVLNHLRNFKNWCTINGYDIVFFVHNTDDINSDGYSEFRAKFGDAISIAEKTEDDIDRFYERSLLVIGMRGHSLMIPWGMGIPCISLGTQEKQKFFMELIGSQDWHIEIFDENLSEKLIKVTRAILDNYSQVQAEIGKKQLKLWQPAKANVEKILCKINLE